MSHARLQVVKIHVAAPYPVKSLAIVKGEGRRRTLYHPALSVAYSEFQPGSRRDTHRANQGLMMWEARVVQLLMHGCVRRIALDTFPVEEFEIRCVGQLRTIAPGNMTFDREERTDRPPVVYFHKVARIDLHEVFFE